MRCLIFAELCIWASIEVGHSKSSDHAVPQVLRCRFLSEVNFLDRQPILLLPQPPLQDVDVRNVRCTLDLCNVDVVLSNADNMLQCWFALTQVVLLFRDPLPCWFSSALAA